MATPTASALSVATARSAWGTLRHTPWIHWAPGRESSTRSAWPSRCLHALHSSLGLLFLFSR